MFQLLTKGSISMVSIQNYSASTPNVAFKARTNKDSALSNAPKSHAGLKTGAVWTSLVAPLGLLGALRYSHLIKNNPTFVKGGNIVANMRANSMKATARTMILAIPINISIAALGCGALVDKLNNDNRAKFAEELAEKGKKATLEDNDNAEETKAGNVYCKSGEGKKWGPLFGMTVLTGMGLFEALYTHVKVGKQSNAMTLAAVAGIAWNAIIGAVGGLTLGAIADHYSNKTAEKQADKLARSTENHKADKAETPKADDVKEADNEKNTEKE